MKKIAIICPYPYDIAPGQRFRFEQYLDYLQAQGIEVLLFPFLDKQTNNILYQSGKTSQKILGVLKGVGKRFLLLFQLYQFDYLLVHREAMLIGPPIWEWIACRLLGKKMILDFDDAIWIDKTANNSKLIGKLRNPAKTADLCKWAYKVSCGNEFLANYAKQFNQQVIHLPTTIDTENYHNKIKQHQANKKIIIGWTGTITTMLYLDIIYPVVAKLAQKYPIELRIIANRAPQNKASFIKFVPWNKNSEITDLLAFDIGIMPMMNTEWEKGKCGFKALQYMALGIPAVVSPSGVNGKIVVAEENGLWATSPEEWYTQLERLIQEVSLRKKLGEAGRQTVIEKYSVLAQRSAYFKLFQ